MAKPVLVPYRNPKKVKAYLDAAAIAGIEFLAADVAQPIVFDGSGGLLLTGGTDVNPKLYGAVPQPETDEPDDERDQAEVELLAKALERDLPILAICRGMQLLNVFDGGDLVQHLGSARHDVESEDKGQAAHPVAIERESLLSSIAGTGEWQVNSRHHQAIHNQGSHLKVTARDPADGTIEALERPDRGFVLGVQWHPEDQLVHAPEQLKLFLRFGAAIQGNSRALPLTHARG
ncbi:MAG TPA: gamma-glutamyl-gamma-aminobutyrate hydrolase family protein [Bryobacteraceae bacterium]|nr:gamma-glutamyl-gamma-aminobutyrate hydrolase family protein [Bryobacteraceae bacterium]